MNPFCTYKNIFGKPNEGIHATRLFGVAIWDVIFTVIVAIIISNKFKKDFIVVLLVLFITSIVIHSIFCVDTAINRAIGISIF